MATRAATAISDADLLHAAILLVDDHPMNVRLLELTLRREGYTTVLSTTDPHEVVRMYREFQPALILLDLRMPGLSGFQVMDELKLVAPEGGLPVLVLTSDASAQTRRRALEAGARAVLSKPFDRLDLLHYVRTLLYVSLLEQQIRDGQRTPPRRRPRRPEERARLERSQDD